MVIGSGWGMWQEPHDGSALEGCEFTDLVNRKIDYDTVIVHMIPEYFTRWRSLELGKRIIGMTVWELDVVPPNWVDWMNQLDAIIVPCQWNREVFLAAGVRPPIHVVPHVAEPVVATKQVQLAGVNPDDYVFYTIAAWRERNAPHLTLTSFLSEFSAQEKAILVIKTSATNERRRSDGFWRHHVMRHFETTRRDFEQIRKRTSSSARVLLVTEDWTSDQINALHLRGDCYVSMTRAEGWGLGAFEAAQAGNPVVITGHGGQLDFLPSALSYQVGYQLVPSSGRELVNIGAKWAEPDLAMGGKLMREVYQNQDEAAKKGTMLHQHVEGRFSTETIINDMLGFLKSLPLA